MFEVTVSPEVAFTRIDGGGTRRVKLADGTVLTFSRHATLIAKVPPEVAADKHLVVRKVGASASAEPAAPAAPADGPEPNPDTDKKGDRVQITNAPPPETDKKGDRVQLSGLTYGELVKKAHDLGVDASGKQEVLRKRLSAHIASTKPPQD